MRAARQQRNSGAIRVARLDPAPVLREFLHRNRRLSCCSKGPFKVAGHKPSKGSVMDKEAGSSRPLARNKPEKHFVLSGSNRTSRRFPRFTNRKKRSNPYLNGGVLASIDSTN
jgi:hypothetical protein